MMKAKIQSETDYIIDQWQEHFVNMYNCELVIYGIGKNTKVILDNFPSNNIIGLMDESRTGESIYDRPIISIEEVQSLGVKAIVIVARASNVSIIYRRIADVCTANSIDVYDITGKLLNFNYIEEKSFEKYESITEEGLKAKIDNAEVVSFDVFDTLLMRRVLYPRDVFALLDKRIMPGFSSKRINAEMELYREGKHPTIYDIYERIPGVSPDLEIALETECLVERKSMTAMLQYAHETGKSVYLVSDMYLPKRVICGILCNLGIFIEPENVLVSCDNGVSKAGGLFDVLRARVGAKRILHIGDSLEADIESAKRYGIEETFRIEGAVSMLEDSYASDILKYDNLLSNRMLIGEFISVQLNDPFIFSKTQGKFLLNGTYDMSYSLIAPLLYCFFGWLVKKARELQLDWILLSARDGFVFEKIGDLLNSQGADLPHLVYFYSSRTATILASIQDDEDILHAARLAFAGKTEDMLKSRFNLADNEIRPRGDIDDLNYVLLHREAIMSHAALARKNYLKYIAKIGIPKGAKVGFFDFVSSGTCQKALYNFVDFDLTGLYFAAANSEMEYKSDVKIETMFGVLNVFEKRYNLMENYIFLENIVTSYEPTLQGFDNDGNPLFVKEQRTGEQLRTLREIHGAILDYVKNSKIGLDGVTEIDAAVPDFLLSLFKPQYSTINTEYFNDAELADEFCNRKFSLADIYCGNGRTM